MDLQLDKDTVLTTLKESDKDALVWWLNDKDIYKRTLRIPYPYTEKDALDFIAFCQDKDVRYGRQMTWAIRQSEGKLIGVIGLLGADTFPHKDEIGYWLARDYWGKGIMKRTLKAITNIIIEKYHVVRLEAPIFAFNLHSQKVAEKCGYLFEGTLRKAFNKDGMYFDCRMYSFVKE
jgi:[ribosomal protein S5]-alanine N-acetyltransferase